MRKVIQWIIGGAILAYGVDMLNKGWGLSVALSVIVFGILVMLNTGKKRKADDEDEDW